MADYLREGKIVDIVGEQFNFLLDHVGNCVGDCLECKRLAEVKAILLRPFITARFSPEAFNRGEAFVRGDD